LLPRAEPRQRAAKQAKATAPKHPAAAPNEPIFPLADAGEYYIGLWNGHPNYGCPYCAYAILARSPAEGGAMVEAHIQFKIDQGSPKHDQWLLEEKGDKA
jgi:hypothetical protein